MTRAQVDEALAAIDSGEARATALELIAPCVVPRRQVAEAFNHGGRWLRRVATDPDLERIRDDEDVRGFLVASGRHLLDVTLIAPE